MCEKSIASFYNFYSYCNCVSLEDKIGGGNGSPLQCSCLENPRDGEPGGLPSMGSHRVRHDRSDLAAAEDKINLKLEDYSV